MARIFDIVEAPDQGLNQMVYRVPPSGSGDFRIGSQVIVRENQSAVFFRDGKALDTFGPGRHTITTANIPLLINVIGMAFSGKSPFKAEVYFVNMRDFIDMKWGTPEPISLRDKDLGLVRLRANGRYSMAISDPQMFVAKIVGTQGLYQTSQIEDYLRGIIISRLTDLLGETKAGLFDLPALFDELSAAIRVKVSEDFAALGITLKQMFLGSVSPTEETQKAIDERAAMGAIGDMQKYLQYKAARAMGDAAAAGGGGEAGSAVGTGVGLGAGFGLGAGMAGMISQAIAGAQQQAPAAPGAPAAAAVPEVMTLAEAAAYMRVSEADVEALISSGQLKAKQIGTVYRISKKALDDFLAE
ncbi:MAG: SPFH domain-containing protein [Anaerolineae bacterium]